MCSALTESSLWPLPTPGAERRGFTSYSDDELAAQLGGWVEAGIPRVKMKVGRDPSTDEHRMAVARKEIGDGSALYVDANGAYERKQALRWAQRFAPRGAGADARR